MSEIIEQILEKAEKANIDSGSIGKLREFLISHKSKGNSMIRVREKLNSFRDVLKEVSDSELISDISDLDIIVWGHLDDIFNDLLLSSENGSFSVTKYNMYYEVMTKLRRRIDKGEIELLEFIRKLKLILISINSDVGFYVDKS